MKRITLIFALVAAAFACCKNQEQKPLHPEWTYNSVVYEVNIRQFSPEGTFKGVEAQLPRLKDLGVDVLWLMPMYEIGTVERKGSLGSYYAISDYKKVNPEFGTMEDFQSLVDAAHAQGFKVILDWVANQTAPDNVWMTEKPADFYERDSLGNAIWEYDWTDTRSLNYENEEVWWAQDDAMRFWLEKGVDGFRCDAAGEVPADFWYGILPKMNADYPEAYLLAEAERENLADPTVTFDANYAWELHHLLNSMAQGSKTVKDLQDYVARDASRFPKEAFRLTFTSNHDENSWAGTEFEREGVLANACAVLCFTLPGSQPLIYTGQEIGLDRRLAFFEKDPITDWSANEYTTFWKTLVDLKHNNPALAAGERGGDIVWWEAPDGLVAFHREVDGNKVIVLANFGLTGTEPFQNLKSAPITKILKLDGEYKDVFKNTTVSGGITITLAPGEFLVLTKSAVTRVEPPCWWTGMKTGLQLMVNGPEISAYDNVTFEGLDGVKVAKVTKADSPNYLFVDVTIGPDAASGDGWLVFKNEAGEQFKYPYRIGKKADVQKESFTTKDLIYLIFPDRFANGNPYNDNAPDMQEKANRKVNLGRHGGDIKGIIDHLDYVAGLGATAIWCTPMLVDDQDWESYHGYACGDYYRIDPRMGSNELYKEFVDKAHEKGIKVIMDIVTNHCGTDHWWMKDLPFKDWVHVFPEYTGTNVAFSTNMDPNASKYDLNLQESGWFVPMMPDMNLDNLFVLKYFQQWAAWWIEYAGLDGLRVDTYPYNEKEPMSRWCASVTAEYPWINIVGECWTMSYPQLAYWQADAANADGFNSHLPSIMDFPLCEAMTAAINEGGDNPGWGRGMTRVYDCLSHDFVYADLSNMMTFFANHDHGRMGDTFNHDPAKMKLALTLLATVRGIPQLYNGDELFFSHVPGNDWSDGAKRIDFPGGWEGDPVNFFTPEGRAKDAVAEDIYNYTSTLFTWRKGKEVLHSGKTMHFLGRDNTYAFFRYNDTDAVFVYINNSDSEKAVPWEHYAELAPASVTARNILTGAPVTLAPGLTVPAHSALVAEYSR